MKEFDLPYKVVGSAEYEVLISFSPQCPNSYFFRTIPMHVSTNSGNPMLYPLKL